MIDVSNQIKNAYYKDTIQYDKIKTGSKEYRVNKVIYTDDCYEDGNIFGTAIARTLEFEIENSVDFEKKEVEYFTGIEIDKQVHYIDLGKFIVTDIQPDDTTGINKVSCIDYMLKFNIPFQTDLDFKSNKVTTLQLMQEGCKKCGVELATTEFANDDFIIDSNQFEEGATWRQVVKAIAGISGTFAKIKRDNKLYFIRPRLIDSKKYTAKEIHKMKVNDLMNVSKLKIRNITNDLKVLGVKKESTNDVHTMIVSSMNKIEVKKLTTSVNEPSLIDRHCYSDLEIKRNTHPINVVSLGMSQVEGENITLRDEASIEADGENVIAINDNPFAYNQEKREALIHKLFSAIRGFSYTAYEAKGQMEPYREVGDPVWVMDKDGAIVSSFLFRLTYKSPNGLESEMSAPSIIKATVEYQNEPDELDRLRKTEIIVDKEQGQISAIAEQQSSDGGRIGKLEMTADGLDARFEKMQNDYEDQIATLKTTIAGLQVDVSTKGGQNLFSYASDNFDGSINEVQTTDIRQNSVSGLGYELVIGTARQTAQVKNDTYTISFIYKNTNKLDNASVIINDVSYSLEYTADKWKTFSKTIEVNTNSVTVAFKTDTNEAVYVADLMGNLGTVAMTWSQNANETYTHEVKIGKGVEVRSSNNTYTRLDADGTRIFSSRTNEVTTKFTEEGTDTNHLKANKAEIAGVLIQKVGNQTWFSSLL